MTPEIAKRRLILLRHAKSAWPTGVDDHERPLAKRGEKAAPLLGKYLSGKGLRPDLALVSDAMRTRETWKLVRAAFSPPPSERFVADLYDASAVDMLRVVRTTEPTVRTLLLVGHNPGLQELALELAGGGDEPARIAMRDKFPTAAVAVIDFSTGAWEEIAAGGGELERFVTPGSLAKGGSGR
jgi:phosphohistidine phosphatase